MRHTLLLVILLPAPLLAGPKPGDEGTPEYQAASDLVRRLGDAKFATREEAARKSVDMGTAAVPALTAGTKSADEEVRTRSTALLPKAVAVGWKRRAEAFLADPGARRDLPLLAEWEKLTGTPDAGSRKLYAQVLAAQGSLLDPAAADKKLGAAALAARAMELPTVAQVQAKSRSRSRPGTWPAVLFRPGLLEGTDPARRERRPDGSAVPTRQPGDPRGPRRHGGGPGDPPAGGRVVRSRPADDIWAGQYFALLAYRRPFPEAAPILVRLATKRNMVQIRVVAMEALGKAGSAAAVRALKELLDDASAMHGDLTDKDVGHQVQLRLAALVHGSGKDPKAYKLKELASASLFFGGTADTDTITVRILGFASKADREAGIKKWRDEAAGKK